jgi:hypothetical protein
VGQILWNSGLSIQIAGTALLKTHIVNKKRKIMIHRAPIGTKRKFQPLNASPPEALIKYWV